MRIEIDKKFDAKKDDVQVLINGESVYFRVVEASKIIEDGEGELTDREFEVNAQIFSENLSDELAENKKHLLKPINL